MHKRKVQENIKKLMEENGITLEEMAEMLNYDSKSTVHKHLNVNGNCNALEQLDTVQRYADALKINVFDLIKENAMKLQKYPAPNSSIESSMWLILMEAIKIHIWEQIKDKQLQQIGLNTDDGFLDVPYVSSEKIMLLTFNIPEDDNLDDYDYSDDLFFSEYINKYAEKVLMDEQDIEEAAYMCARDVFFEVDFNFNHQDWEEKEHDSRLYYVKKTSDVLVRVPVHKSSIEGSTYSRRSNDLVEILEK